MGAKALHGPLGGVRVYLMMIDTDPEGVGKILAARPQPARGMMAVELESAELWEAEKRMVPIGPLAAGSLRSALNNILIMFLDSNRRDFASAGELNGVVTR